MAVMTKDQGIRLTSGVLISWLTIVGTLWMFGKPFLVSAVSEAVAEDIQEQVKAGTAPLNRAFVALLRGNIADIRKEIASMEFRRDNPPTDDWVSDDAEDLVDLHLTLEAQEDAVSALTQ